MAKYTRIIIEIVCEEGKQDGIVAAIDNCVGALDHVQSYDVQEEDVEEGDKS